MYIIYITSFGNIFEKLTSLPGVGRKTANLIVGDVYKKPAVVADTHLIRLTNRMGLVNTKDPKKVEMELKKILPPVYGSAILTEPLVHFLMQLLFLQ